MLRCNCKHKAVEHVPGKKEHPCAKPGCTSCKGFFSPWVCNCNHAWAEHDQKVVLKEMRKFPVGAIDDSVIAELNNHAGIRRGEEE